MAFPTLTVNPNYPIVDNIQSAAIKSEFEGGYVLTRARHSRNRRTFQVNYTFLDSTNKELLETHVETVKDITAFDWTDPRVGGATYSVRYQAIPPFQYVSYGRWNCNFILEEV